MAKQEQIPTPEEKTEIEITEHDREMLLINLKMFRSNKEWGSFAVIAEDTKVLFPEINPKDFGTDDEAQQGMKENMEAARKEKKYSHAFAWAGSIKTLWPETNPQKDLNLGKADQERLKTDLKFCSKSKNWRQFAIEAMSGKIIWPELDAKDLGVGKEAVVGMKEELQKDREWLRPDGAQGAWNKFFTQAMAIRVLCPEIDPEKDLGIDDEAREGARKDAETLRDGRWADFSRLAAAMKVVEAKEVKVTDKGLEITSPEK